MTNGTFQNFLDSLRAFESGWDRERYDAGRIVDAQLNQWAGGTVQSFFPQYSSWGDLTDAQWKAMSYTSMNSLGFVGYQFGEPLLIDLGYYDDDVFYGAGAATNTWDGTWTGKNGVDSFEAFKTEAAQEVAIREAFGYNLKVIEDGLGAQGKSLADYLGTMGSYKDGANTINVELTLTGIMAAAHLQGAWGTLNLLLGGAVSRDEYGTSILQYIAQFGDYDSPSIPQAIKYFEDRLTGDEGVGTPTDPTGGDDSGANNPGITAANATHVIDWSYGKKVVDGDFDPEHDTIFIAWVNADALTITENAQGVVFAIPTNNQSLTLSGMKLADLDLSNFNALDATTRAELGSLIEDKDDHHGMGGTMTMITLTSPDKTITDFDPAKDMLHIEEGITAERLNLFEESGDSLGLTTRVQVLDEAGQVLSTVILQGIGLSDLSMANFSVAEQSALNEVAETIGESVTTTPNGDGYPVEYDSDGSNPATSTGASPDGGTKFKANTNADDIVNFDVSKDQIDVGGTSVHGMIITKTPKGELAIDSPWTKAMQIVQGVQIKDMTMDNFAIVGNEHFRQDIGGVMSWELGVGPRERDTVYVRSHEYGVHETVHNFDPKSMKISFLYFGTRERLTVEDTDNGLKIWSMPSGQSLTLTGVKKADLIPGLIEFHHDQIIEDNLETPFGHAVEKMTLIDRTIILTPDGPPGAGTDGFQTRTGDLTGANLGPNDNDNTLYGTSGADSIRGAGGDDVIYGEAGNDRLYGENDDDDLYAGSGNNRLYGGAGDDYFKAGSGTNSFYGGSGSDDYLSYTDSKDGISINLATQTVSGGDAAGDVISGIESVGGSKTGDDEMIGSSGANRLKGYGGDDRFHAGTGNDKVYGGAGDDYIRVGGGVESFYGGSGSEDYISYYSSSGGITIKLEDDSVTGSWANNDVISGFESASGSNKGGDKMYGGAGDNLLRGNGGNDSLYGGSGADKLYGGTGRRQAVWRVRC